MYSMVTRKGLPSLSVAQQAFAIRSRWPGRPPALGRRGLVWTGQLQPSAVSPTYTVKVTYQLGGAPAVHVLDPPLDPGHRERLPHVYCGDRLCLYTPGEWNSSMAIATTIVPWIAEWLYHYELWKATGQWSGGGEDFAP